MGVRPHHCFFFVKGRQMGMVVQANVAVKSKQACVAQTLTVWRSTWDNKDSSLYSSERTAMYKRVLTPSYCHMWQSCFPLSLLSHKCVPSVAFKSKIAYAEISLNQAFKIYYPVQPTTPSSEVYYYPTIPTETPNVHPLSKPPSRKVGHARYKDIPKMVKTLLLWVWDLVTMPWTIFSITSFSKIKPLLTQTVSTQSFPQKLLPGST